MPRDKDGKLIPRPFKLSETKPRHRNPFDDDDENKAPARDPDVWETSEEEAARLEREKVEKAAANQKRRELAEKAHLYGTQTATKPRKRTESARTRNAAASRTRSPKRTTVATSRLSTTRSDDGAERR